MNRLFPRLITVVMLVTVIGCSHALAPGSPADAPGRTSAARPAPSLTACDLITQQDVKAVTGEDDAGELTEGDQAHVSICTYSAALVRFSPELGNQDAAMNEDPGAIPVPGLGDTAYTYVDSSTGHDQNVLSVTKGTGQLYMVSMDLDVDDLVALARLGLARLG